MKKILDKLFGVLGGGIADKISSIIDKHTFSKVEKAEMEKEMTEIFINAESNIQESITKRWEADLKSDSKLAKSIRPLTLIFLTVSLILFILLDSFYIEIFIIDSEWIELLKVLLTSVFVSYFGGRSYEKAKK